jgi:hypothetical protein
MTLQIPLKYMVLEEVEEMEMQLFQVPVVVAAHTY